MRKSKVNAWYGWVPDQPDYRDKLYSAIAAPPKKLPPKVDLRAGCSRVENQAFIKLAQQVKEMTRYAAEHAVTIAVMGCRVNGPGETDDADLGLWCAPTHVNLKRKSETIGAFRYDEVLARLKVELDRLLAERGGGETRPREPVRVRRTGP